MNIEKNFALIEALDLDSVKARLMQQESGEGWPRSRADAVEFEYRRFLYLMMKFPDQQVAPLLDVDVFWHYHILDTMKYAADCARTFGYFLHHRPHSGPVSTSDIADHHRSGARMQALYETTFGDAYFHQDNTQAETAAWCTPATRATAWCTPARADAAAASAPAWCTLATQQAAWCTPLSANIAWCTPSAQTSAWCTPAAQNKAGPRMPTPNVSSHARAVLAAPA